MRACHRSRGPLTLSLGGTAAQRSMHPSRLLQIVFRRICIHFRPHRTTPEAPEAQGPVEADLICRSRRGDLYSHIRFYKFRTQRTDASSHPHHAKEEKVYNLDRGRAGTNMSRPLCSSCASLRSTTKAIKTLRHLPSASTYRVIRPFSSTMPIATNTNMTDVEANRLKVGSRDLDTGTPRRARHRTRIRRCPRPHARRPHSLPLPFPFIPSSPTVLVW